MKLNHLRCTGEFPKETAREIYLEINKMDKGTYLLTITNNNKVITQIHFEK